MFHPKSPYHAKVCADVVLVNPPGVVQIIHTKYKQNHLLAMMQVY